MKLLFLIGRLFPMVTEAHLEAREARPGAMEAHPGVLLYTDDYHEDVEA